MTMKKLQNLTIFSDGSLYFNLTFTNKNPLILQKKTKDLKNYQKLLNQNSSKSLSNINHNIITENFRSKLFK